MPKKDTPAKKTRKTKAKSTKAKAGARASVVSNIQNKIVIGDLGGSKKPRRRRASNKPKQPTQPQIPVAAFSSPYMTFGLPPQYDPPRIKENPVDEPPATAPPPLLKAPPTKPLLEAPPTRPLLEAPLPPTLLKAPPTPSEPEEVPPQSTELALREPRSTDIGTDLVVREPQNSSIYNNTLTNYYPPKSKKIQPLIRDEWASYENPLPFANEDIPTDTSTFEDITSPPTIRPARGRPKSDDQMRNLKAKLHDVNNQLKRGGIKKESTMNRLLEKKQKYEDEIATLQNIPVSLSAKLARKLPSAEEEEFDANAMFSKPLIAEPSPIAKPLVKKSSSGKKLIYKGRTTQNEEDDDNDVFTIIPEPKENLKTPDDENSLSASLGDVYSTVSSAVSSSVIKPLIDTGSNLLKSYNPMMSMPKVDLVEEGASQKRDLLNLSTPNESDKFDRLIKELEKDKQLFNKKLDIFERGTGDPDEEEVDKKNAEFYMYLINDKVKDFLDEARQTNPEKYADYITELSQKGLLNLSIGKSNRFQTPLKGGRQGASMRRKEEWNALPDGTQLELTYNNSNRIYTKQGDGVVDDDGIQYKSLNDAVRKYKASIGDTKGFGSAYGMFKILEPVESKSPAGKVTKVKVTKVTKMPNP